MTPLERAQASLARADHALAQPRAEGPTWQLPEPEPKAPATTTPNARTAQRQWDNRIRDIATEQVSLGVNAVGEVMKGELQILRAAIANRDSRIALLEQRFAELEAKVGGSNS